MKVLNKIPPALPINPKEHVPSLVNKVVLIEGNEVLQLAVQENSVHGMLASDFGLQQLITAGATELLKPCPKLTGSRTDIADNVESVIENFEPQYETETNNE